MADYYSLALPLAYLPHIDPSPVLVEPTDSPRLRKCVEQFAWHFKREIHTDFVQFEATEGPGTPDFIRYEAYLFHEPSEVEHRGHLKVRFFGACCFRWREWENAPHEWSLDWIWLHPYFRGKQHLRNAWPRFEHRYGRFHLAHPFSAGMEKFLQRVGRLQPRGPLEMVGKTGGTI